MIVIPFAILPARFVSLKSAKWKFMEQKAQSGQKIDITRNVCVRWANESNE